MAESAAVFSSGATVRLIQSDRWTDSDVVLFNNDLQFLFAERYPEGFSVPRRGTQNRVHVGGRFTVDSRKCSTAAAPTSALRDKFSDGRDAGSDSAFLSDQIRFAAPELSRADRFDSGCRRSVLRDN